MQSRSAFLSPKLVLTDIEGTTTPIAFVRDTLFPYARSRLAAFIQRPDPAVQGALAAVPGPDRLATLLAWMDADAKEGPLKALQGMIWAVGYADGTLKGALYTDVAPALQAWHRAGVRMAVYSSGSVAAQRLLFRHSVAGNLEPLFANFFDTGVGNKREPGSYAAIARAVVQEPSAILFLSDIEAELDAAAAAGLDTCQLVRAADGTQASARHRRAGDFWGVQGGCS